MSPRSARYRVGQVLSLLAARRNPPDEAPAAHVLPEPLLAIWRRMPPEDQRHSLRVLADLEAEIDAGAESNLAGARGGVDGGPGDRQVAPTDHAMALLQAGLLHDVGKAEAGIGLPHRVLRVLLREAMPGLWAWLSGTPTGWRRPFWAVAHHPERGAIWAETQGAGADVVALIRYHESEPPADWAGQALANWHARLASADARS